MQAYVVRGNFGIVVRAESAEEAIQKVTNELEQDYDCTFVIIEDSEVLE